ncbi:CinA family protein [Pseudonocardia sp. CA-107938]|uniref:CinA family protein n=1 Tax=Pseudonocardia sp. CA-107938 TaxID=3240021 RepID=UPI003D940430
MTVEDGPDPQDRLAADVGRSADAAGVTLAVAESITGGRIAARLAAAEGASSWFRGAVVAYASEVKHGVLGVAPGPVVSAPAAEQMAEGVRRVLGADVAVAVTGAGGPDPQDGQPPGTVFLAVAGRGPVTVLQHELPGDPATVCEQTEQLALEQLLTRLTPQDGGAS